MRKILIASRDLKIGGIEKALISLTNYLLEHNYDVKLVLEKKEGELLKKINKKIEIIEYTPSSNKIIIFRKVINLLKKVKFLIKYKNKFDVSISFATYSQVGSFVARNVSKNSVLWCHADYLELFKQDKQEVIEFFENIYYDDFKKIVFVSKKGKETFKKVFPRQKNVYYCNNLINSKEIYELAKQQVDIKYRPEITTFLNVGRHDEKQKKLSRIIAASKRLKEENYKFRVIFVGSGQATKKYEKIIKKYKLEKNIILVGAKENPYPYFRISNCLILSSDYEGYPVVFLESYVLNKPIITTDVSDYGDIQNGRGIVVKKAEKEIYGAMKRFINSGYKLNRKFNAIEYNSSVEKKLQEILEKF